MSEIVYVSRTEADLERAEAQLRDAEIAYEVSLEAVPDEESERRVCYQRLVIRVAVEAAVRARDVLAVQPRTSVDL